MVSMTTIIYEYFNLIGQKPNFNNIVSYMKYIFM